jgi:uncharacterized protein with PIN domain
VLRRVDAVLVSLAEAETVLLSSCCHLEASIVAALRLSDAGQAELEHLLDVFSVEVTSFTPDHRCPCSPWVMTSRVPTSR